MKKQEEPSENQDSNQIRSVNCVQQKSNSESETGNLKSKNRVEMEVDLWDEHNKREVLNHAGGGAQNGVVLGKSRYFCRGVSSELTATSLS